MAPKANSKDWCEHAETTNILFWFFLTVYLQYKIEICVKIVRKLQIFCHPKRSVLHKMHNFFVHKTKMKKRPVLGTLQNVHSFTNYITFCPKKAPKISCDIRNSIKLSLILGSTVHITNFANHKIVTKNLDFARYDPFMIFGTSTFFVFCGAMLFWVLQNLVSETPFWVLSCIK